MAEKDKRVRLLEVLISLQEQFVERALDTDHRVTAQNKLDELKLEYRKRTGLQYYPPVRIDDGGMEIKYGKN